MHIKSVFFENWLYLNLNKQNSIRHLLRDIDRTAYYVQNLNIDIQQLLDISLPNKRMYIEFIK